MSSTNRGAVRNEHDFYETPDYSVYSLMEKIGSDLLWHPGRWLEPCVGNGAIIKAMMNWYQKEEVNLNGKDFLPLFDAVDIRREAEYPHITADFLNWKPQERYSLIITNPPFFKAQEIVERSLTINGNNPPPTVIMLLRLNFLGAEKRSEWWQHRTPGYLWTLSERPDFTGDGGDSCEYAWYLWNFEGHKHLKHIDVLPPWEGFDKQLRIA